MFRGVTLYTPPTFRLMASRKLFGCNQIKWFEHIFVYVTIGGDVCVCVCVWWDEIRRSVYHCCHQLFTKYIYITPQSEAITDRILNQFRLWHLCCVFVGLVEQYSVEFRLWVVDIYIYIYSPTHINKARASRKRWAQYLLMPLCRTFLRSSLTTNKCFTAKANRHLYQIWKSQFTRRSWFRSSCTPVLVVIINWLYVGDPHTSVWKHKSTNTHTHHSDITMIWRKDIRALIFADCRTINLTHPWITHLKRQRCWPEKMGFRGWSE